MKKHHKVLLSVAALAAAGGLILAKNDTSQQNVASEPIATPLPAITPNSICDASLWEHVYTGDKRKFSKPQDRLQVIKDCVTVTGTIETAIAEKDGDFHIRLRLDPEYASMLNAKNISGQRGDLVLEPVCENTVSQSDTLKEGVCDGFSQDVYQKSMLGKHVQVVGAYVTDMEHGWSEVHPVTSITVIK